MNVSRRIFLAEVREQPAALLTLLEQLDAFVAAGRACAERKPTAVRLESMPDQYDERIEGSWRDWGRFRAVVHRDVREALS